MARNKYDYTQLVIGDCGHTCVVWPQRHIIGDSGNQVVCTVCTKEKYGVTDDENLVVWVYREKKPESKEASKTPAKPKAKPVKCSVCQQKGHLYTDCPLMVGQTELFDG